MIKRHYFMSAKIYGNNQCPVWNGSAQHHHVSFFGKPDKVFNEMVKSLEYSAELSGHKPWDMCIEVFCRL